MANGGWIKLHRQITESAVFSNPNILKVWIWILCNVSHKEHEVLVGKQVVKLEEGQMIFGRKKASALLEMNDRTLYDYIKTLQALDMIHVKSNTVYSVITVVNWRFFQGVQDDDQQRLS